MEVIIQPDAHAASILAAQRIADIIRQKPAATLGLATGGSPLALYAELIRLHREEGLDFQHVTTFNLDEYLGLSPSHPSSYNTFMWQNLFRHINVNPARVFVPSGMVDGRDLEKYCTRYEEEIRKAGGIDLQVLGIGANGHIGFNEPGSSLSSRTRIKTLAPQTVEDNRRYFDAAHAVPLHVITMGIGTILEAGELCLLGFGEKKSAGRGCGGGRSAHRIRPRLGAATASESRCPSRRGGGRPPPVLGILSLGFQEQAF